MLDEQIGAAVGVAGSVVLGPVVLTLATERPRAVADAGTSVTAITPKGEGYPS